MSCFVYHEKIRIAFEIIIIVIIIIFHSLQSLQMMLERSFLNLCLLGVLSKVKYLLTMATYTQFIQTIPLNMFAVGHGRGDLKLREKR